MSKVEEFKKVLPMQCKGCALKRGTGNFFTVVDSATLNPRHGLYVKEARTRKGSQGYWWGLNVNQLTSLNRMTCQRWVVLLFGSEEQGHVARGEDVKRLAASGAWSLQRSKRGVPITPEYKLKENTLPRQFSKCQNFKEIFGVMDLSKG